LAHSSSRTSQRHPSAVHAAFRTMTSGYSSPFCINARDAVDAHLEAHGRCRDPAPGLRRARLPPRGAWQRHRHDGVKVRRKLGLGRVSGGTDRADDGGLERERGRVGSAAHASKTKFAPYFDAVMQRLVHCIQLTTEGEEVRAELLGADRLGEGADRVLRDAAEVELLALRGEPRSRSRPPSSARSVPPLTRPRPSLRRTLTPSCSGGDRLLHQRAVVRAELLGADRLGEGADRVLRDAHGRHPRRGGRRRAVPPVLRPADAAGDRRRRDRDSVVSWMQWTRRCMTASKYGANLVLDA
jgi:hypothetical protein